MDVPGDVINSSDIEYQPAVGKRSGRNVGQASIQEIINGAVRDRFSSKRTIKQLEFGNGAPSTRISQELWVGRFSAFRTVTLMQSLDQRFTGADLIRFFDTVIGKLKLVIGKPAPHIDCVQSGLRVLSAYGTFSYPDFKLTPHDAIRIQTWVDDAVKAGRLMRGRAKKRVWLNFTTMARMSQIWLSHHHKHGTWTWDVTLSKLMSVALVTSLGCRAGDVARSLLYEGTEYLQYEHVVLKLEGNELSFKNLRAHITLKYTKGSKPCENEDLEFYLRPLDSKYQQICPITLLLIHALRHGLVHGSTIEQVLTHTLNTADRRVHWTFPKRPIVASFTRLMTRACDLDKPGGTHQILCSVKEMGIVANILTRVYTHALRHGAAQDVAHLPATKNGGGFVTGQVAQFLGHSEAARQHGITENYAGAPTREYYNDRADQEFVHRWAPQFSATSAMDLKKRRVTDGEIQEWQARVEPLEDDRTSPKARRRAQESIRRERLNLFVQAAEPEITPINKQPKRILQKPKGKRVEGEDRALPARASPTRAGPSQHDLSHTHLDRSLIDPRLLDEDALNDAEVDKREFEMLQSSLSLEKSVPGKDDQSEDDGELAALADKVFLEEMCVEDDGTDNEEQSLMSPFTFINFYARINVVKKQCFAIAWPSYNAGKASLADSIGPHSVRGNSRDDPTPFEITCMKTAGCPFKSLLQYNVDEHEHMCSQDYVTRKIEHGSESRDFLCPRDGCTATFLDRHQLLNHEGSVHSFRPRACDAGAGCDPNILYYKHNAYFQHLQSHTGRWPARCTYPDCNEEKLWPNVNKYRLHLQKAHKLTNPDERASYLPPDLRVKMKKTWVPTTCFITGCTSKAAFSNYSNMKRHLTSLHDFSSEKAEESAQRGFTLQPAAEAVVKKRPSKQVTDYDDSSDSEAPRGPRARKRKT